MPSYFQFLLPEEIILNYFSGFYRYYLKLYAYSVPSRFFTIDHCLLIFYWKGWGFSPIIHSYPLPSCKWPGIYQWARQSPHTYKFIFWYEKVTNRQVTSSSTSNLQPVGNEYFCDPANIIVCEKCFNKNFIS